MASADGIGPGERSQHHRRAGLAPAPMEQRDRQPQSRERQETQEQQFYNVSPGGRDRPICALTLARVATSRSQS